MKVLETLATRRGTSFFTVMAILERFVDQRERVGGVASPERESIRFSHEASLQSPANEIAGVRPEPRYERGQPRPAEEWNYEVSTCFLGLTGTDSPLPLYMVEELVQDAPSAELQRHFLDIFHNRIVALFYRGVVRCHHPREMLSDGGDDATWKALQFSGVDVDAERCEYLTRVQRLHVAGLFAGGRPTPRSVENALRALLREHLGGATLRLRQFTGGWVPIEPDQLNRLGRVNNAIGRTFFLGRRVRHPAHEARLVIGPLALERAASFGPGGAGFEAARTLIDRLLPSAVIVRLELHVRDSAYPPFVLGRRRLARDTCIVAVEDRAGRVRIVEHDLSQAPRTRRVQPPTPSSP